MLILKSGKYSLYMIDLDEANMNEADLDQLNFEKSKYSRSEEPLFSYHHDDVKGKKFLALHVRGSSRKEVLDRNEKQFVYFLHEGGLYSWTYLNEDSKKDKIKFVSETSSLQFD